MGSSDARAREWVEAQLLDQIKEATIEEMPEEELGDKYPVASPRTNPTLRPGSKRPREGETETVPQL